MGKTIRANGKERGPIGTKNNRVTRPDRHRKHKPYGFTSEQVIGKIALGKMKQMQMNMKNMQAYKINTKQGQIGRKK